MSTTEPQEAPPPRATLSELVALSSNTYPRKKIMAAGDEDIPSLELSPSVQSNAQEKAGKDNHKSRSIEKHNVSVGHLAPVSRSIAPNLPQTSSTKQPSPPNSTHASALLSQYRASTSFIEQTSSRKRDNGSVSSMNMVPDYNRQELEFRSTGLTSYGACPRDYSRNSRQVSQVTLDEVSELIRTRQGHLVNDSVSVTLVMNVISEECGWTDVELNEDLQVLAGNRLRTVKALRLLSKNGWDNLTGLTPITKDILKTAIGIVAD
ncbi:hypothetical protein HDU81_005495 [Chytriomyces hyalinus]|nr:hypothetical protein HDU81_005495 [Chytriomyces hyalinus]